MEDTTPLSDGEFRELHRAVQEAALVAYPNPDRVGCPGPRVLRDIAYTPWPSDHPVYKHITECSPCLREMLEFRSEYVDKRQRRKRFAWVGVAAMLAVAVALGLTFWLKQKHHDKAAVVEMAQTNPPALSISLQPDLSRSAQNARETPSIVLPSRPVKLQFLLSNEDKKHAYYGVVLQDAAGTVISRTDNVRIMALPQGGWSIPVNYSSRLFEAGDYAMVLHAGPTKDKTQIIEVYNFSCRR